MRRIPSFLALRAFEAAARLGSFARACEELHLTPSAVSHQVRALERHFGRALFLRSNRRVSLTPDGERLLTALSCAFDAIETACADLSPSSAAASLSVHCKPIFASAWLSPRLPHFIEQHPSVSIRLSSGAESIDLQRHDDIDVVIAYGKAPSGPGLTVLALGEEEIAALCTPEMARRAASVDAAAVETFARLDSSFSPVRWPDWFSANGLPPPSTRASASFDRGALVISAAVQGMGLALESLRFAKAQIDDGSLVRLGAGRFRSLHRELHFLCYRSRDEYSRNVVAFRDWLKGLN